MINMNYIVTNFRRVTPTVKCCRNVNFRARNPPDPHFDRKRMLEVCKPISLPNRSPEWETCGKANIIIEEKPHPFEVLLCEDLKKSWDASRMILFYHLGPLTARTQKEIRNSFFKEDFHFFVYSSNVMKLAVAGTPYTSVLHLYESKTAVVFSEEISINKLLKVNRKVQLQGIALLAGIIDDVFYSKNQVQELGEVLKRDSHSELSQLLNCIPSKFKNTVNHQTQLLSHYLSEISKGT